MLHFFNKVYKTTLYKLRKVRTKVRGEEGSDQKWRHYTVKMRTRGTVSLKSIFFFISTCHLALSRLKAHSIGLHALLNMELKTALSFDLHVLYSFMQYGSNGLARSPIR